MELTDRKKELKERVNSTKKVILPQLREYLNALIELDFSVIKDYISEEEREVLSDLKVYKEIAIYNIFARAEKLLKENGIPANIPFKTLKLDSKIYSDFLYLEEYNNGQETPKIGSIRLLEFTRDEKLQESQRNFLRNYLETIKITPSSGVRIPFFRNKNQKEEIAYCNRLLTDLESIEELTEQQERLIEMSKKANEIILKDYGITSFDYEELPNNPHTIYEKTLVKTKPDFEIRKWVRNI